MEEDKIIFSKEGRTIDDDFNDGDVLFYTLNCLYNNREQSYGDCLENIKNIFQDYYINDDEFKKMFNKFFYIGENLIAPDFIASKAYFDSFNIWNFDHYRHFNFIKRALVCRKMVIGKGKKYYGFFYYFTKPLFQNAGFNSSDYKVEMARNFFNIFFDYNNYIEEIDNLVKVIKNQDYQNDLSLYIKDQDVLLLIGKTFTLDMNDFINADHYFQIMMFKNNAKKLIETLIYIVNTTKPSKDSVLNEINNANTNNYWYLNLKFPLVINFNEDIFVDLITSIDALYDNELFYYKRHDSYPLVLKLGDFKKFKNSKKIKKFASRCNADDLIFFWLMNKRNYKYLNRIIYLWMKTIPDKDREILSMYYGLGNDSKVYSLEEISLLTTLNVKQLKKNLIVSIDKLKTNGGFFFEALAEFIVKKLIIPKDFNDQVLENNLSFIVNILYTNLYPYGHIYCLGNSLGGQDNE